MLADDAWLSFFLKNEQLSTCFVMFGENFLTDVDK